MDNFMSILTAEERSRLSLEDRVRLGELASAIVHGATDAERQEVAAIKERAKMKTYKARDEFRNVPGRGNGYLVARSAQVPKRDEIVEIDGERISVHSVEAFMILTSPPKPSKDMIIYGESVHDETP